MKIAAVTEAIKAHPALEPLVVHTGQHYDAAMSKVMFDDLGLPEPDINLEVGSSSIAVQTGAIMTRFEPVVDEHRPDLVVVVGDVNSTVACAFVAKQKGIAVAHVEAGLRSRDRGMPEEINRVLTDCISDLLFVSEASGMTNLRAEGVPDKHLFFVGNVMIDTLLRHKAGADRSDVLSRLGREPKSYAVLTLHRPSNVDSPEATAHILKILDDVQAKVPVVWPIHPRTRARLERFGLAGQLEAMPGIIALEPLGYLDFLKLTAEARLVLTDSGGIQEETTILHVPCLTLRENTERPSTIDAGLNRLVGTDHDLIVSCVDDILATGDPRAAEPEKWDGKAGERIVDVLLQCAEQGFPLR
jgi:UDP-N-acetylglucosamine 2-epimerase (non-hydrolysing)